MISLLSISVTVSIKACNLYIQMLWQRYKFNKNSEVHNDNHDLFSKQRYSEEKVVTEHLPQTKVRIHTNSSDFKSIQKTCRSVPNTIILNKKRS